VAVSRVQERAQERLRRLAGAGLDVEAFWRSATAEIASAVDFDWRPCWFTLDPASLVITSHFNEEIDELDDAVFHNEYVDNDFNKMADVAAAGQHVVTLARATEGDLSRSPRFRDLLSGNGLAHELVAILRSGETCWASVTLYREKGRDDFSDEDLAFLHVVGPLLAEGARRGLLIGEAYDAGAVQSPAEPDAAPAVVVLDAALGIRSMTASGTWWLLQLNGSRERVPAALRAVAAAALDDATEPETQPPFARVRTRTGSWAFLHGSRLEQNGSEVAVIVEPASPERLGSLLMAAYGLTAREQAIAQQVLQGASTEEIARKLHLSPYTVQDHLKSVFEKTDVRSRGQLLATVFFDHFRPRVRDNESRVRAGRMIRGGPLWETTAD
jgi:DNA-binding CsgD family transcriptional regulator